MSNLALKVLAEFSDEDKVKIKSWAEEAYIIRNDSSLTKKEKLNKISSITNKNKIVFKFLRSLVCLIKRNTWDERGWPGRLALGGFALGVITSGSKMAGIASAGIGVGLPIYLLTSAGGALLGTIIEELHHKN